MQRISLAVIAFDAGTQVRASIDEATVSVYAERMTEGDAFPPIVVFHDGNQHYLADGFHRVMAAQRVQWREIDADVRAGTKADAIWFALGANRANGKQMTADDKSHAITLALAQWPEKLHREIAEQIGCSISLVSKVIGKNTGVKPDIRGRALQSQIKRCEVRKMVEAGETSVAIKEKLHAHTSMIAEVREELGKPRQDKSRGAVAQRRKDVRDMAERGYSTRQIVAALGISSETVGVIAKKEGIVIHADRVVGRTRRHDANRILERIVTDAENLTVGSELIDFADVDHDQLGAWLSSLQASSKALRAFIRRLEEEQKKHGEAA